LRALDHLRLDGAGGRMRVLLQALSLERSLSGQALWQGLGAQTLRNGLVHHHTMVTGLAATWVHTESQGDYSLAPCPSVHSRDSDLIGRLFWCHACKEGYKMSQNRAIDTLTGCIVGVLCDSAATLFLSLESVAHSTCICSSKHARQLKSSMPHN
jgi:hypothetical protein